MKYISTDIQKLNYYPSHYSPVSVEQFVFFFIYYTDYINSINIL
jgi:hypothetical protein